MKVLLSRMDVNADIIALKLEYKMAKKFTFIYNPHAGHKDYKSFKTVESFISKHTPNSKLYKTERKGHATQLAIEALNESRVPVAVGGDGTVNEVARAVIDTNHYMGIVPKGSGNGVARHLGISMNIQNALQTLLKATPQNVDSGEVNKHPFVMLMGIGFDAEVALAMSKESKRGLTKYAHLALLTYSKFEPLELEFQADENIYQETAFMFNVSNSSQFGNNFYQAPKANMQDGRLDLGIIKPFPLWNAPEIALRMTQKNIDNSSYQMGFTVKNVKVKNKIRFINLDGESIEINDPLSIKVHPSSLHIIAP